MDEQPPRRAAVHELAAELLLLREERAALRAQLDGARARQPMRELDRAAVHLALAEVEAGRRKHGDSVERAGDEKRLRILVEEVGEVARAIEELHLAARLAQYQAPESDAIRAWAEAREHLLQEVAQVAATAIRWLSGELERDVAHRDVKPENMIQPEGDHA